MKKRFRLTAWAFVTMLLLAACIPAAAPNAPTSEPAAAPTEAPAQERGLTVDREVSLTGFDDIMLAEYAHPPLTTLHQPAHDIGVQLCQM